MARTFKGSIKLDIRDSKPDWEAFLDTRAPKDAPNVLVILYDDTGQAAWSPYGGRIEMPTMDRLAKKGLTYTQWHTTAVCSPTRSTFLTGRNHRRRRRAAGMSTTRNDGDSGGLRRTHSRVSFKILAEVEFAADTQGVIVAQGSRFGGYSLFVKEGQVTFVYNFLGIPPEQRLAGPAPKSGQHIVGVEFVKKSSGKSMEALGTMTLYVDDKPAGSAGFRTQSGHYALCGEGLCVGYDSGDAVSKEYIPKFPYSGGRIVKVVFDVAKDAYVDVERRFAAVMARD
jgi:hypothetical protein